jgi:NAD(P)H-dependent FMN reductase
MPVREDPRIAVFIGSVRPNRFSEKPAQWVYERLLARPGVEAEMIDLRDHPLPFFEEPKAPAYTLRDYPNQEMARLGERLDAADGFVFVTPEYNHGPPAALKNALDHTFPEWHRKPVSFVGSGNVGGARAIEQLRAIVVELEMAPLRHAVHILPDVMRPAIEADYSPQLFSSLEPRLERLIDDLIWWTRALAVARSEGK